MLPGFVLAESAGATAPGPCGCLGPSPGQGFSPPREGLELAGTGTGTGPLCQEARRPWVNTQPGPPAWQGRGLAQGPGSAPQPPSLPQNPGTPRGPSPLSLGRRALSHGCAHGSHLHTQLPGAGRAPGRLLPGGSLQPGPRPGRGWWPRPRGHPHASQEASAGPGLLSPDTWGKCRPPAPVTWAGTAHRDREGRSAAHQAGPALPTPSQARRGSCPAGAPGLRALGGERVNFHAKQEPAAAASRPRGEGARTHRGRSAS